MFHKPSFDFGTLALVLCVLAALLASSCTTSRPAPNSVGRHEHSHDRRTKQREPYATSYTAGTNLTTTTGR